MFTNRNVDNEICQQAGEYKRRHGIPIADCIIAAKPSLLNVEMFTKIFREFELIRCLGGKPVLGFVNIGSRRHLFQKSCQNTNTQSFTIYESWPLSFTLKLHLPLFQAQALDPSTPLTQIVFKPHSWLCVSCHLICFCEQFPNSSNHLSFLFKLIPVP